MVYPRFKLPNDGMREDVCGLLAAVGRQLARKNIIKGSVRTGIREDEVSLKDFVRSEHRVHPVLEVRGAAEDKLEVIVHLDPEDGNEAKRLIGLVARRRMVVAVDESKKRYLGALLEALHPVAITPPLPAENGNGGVFSELVLRGRPNADNTVQIG